MADTDNRKPAAAQKSGSAEAEALDSFLSRESSTKKASSSAPNTRRRTVAILAGCAGAVALLVGIIIFLNHSPKPVESEDLYAEAWTIATVDEAGLHTVEVPTDSAGEPRRNGSGILLDYAPSLITDIRVENASGSFSIRAHTDEGQATVYQLAGYERFPLQKGAPDAVANDAGNLRFMTIASAGGKLADFGLEAPRARVYVTYTDSTVARINIGDDAPGQAGAYISFGDAENVYLVSSDAVDAFLYDVTDFISKEITSGAESADNASFQRLSLTGSHYAQPITLEPNDDNAVNYQYRITSPFNGFADAVMSADIAGSVRDLYAEEVVAVNVDGADTAAFLSRYGLNGSGYAEVSADYPDASFRLRAGTPDSEGNVYLANLGDPAIGGAVIYKIQIGALGWASASVDHLAADTVLSVRRTALDSLAVTAGDRTLDIDVDTRTQSVTTTDGDTEEITTTEAYYDGRLLGDESFTILLQNLTEMPNSGITDAPSSDVMLRIRYTYTTGRAADTVTVYGSSGKSCAVALNGNIIGSVAKSYADALIGNMDDIIAGKTPKSM